MGRGAWGVFLPYCLSPIACYLVALILSPSIKRGSGGVFPPELLPGMFPPELLPGVFPPELLPGMFLPYRLSPIAYRLKE